MVMPVNAEDVAAAWEAEWIGAAAKPAAATKPANAPAIVLKSAFYGVKGSQALQVDLTEKFQAQLAAGRYTLGADNDIVGKDPAYGKVKTLELVYSRAGQRLEKSVAEGMEINLLTDALTKLAKKGSRVNEWSCYRKTFQLAAPPKSAVARIAVDSKYWLYVNGEMVVFEGQLKRGPTPRDTYYDVVDFTEYLQKGENTIAVLVWFFGKSGFSHNSSGKAGLVFDAKIDGQALVSNHQWKALLHPAFGNTGKPQPNYRLPESNILFDARLDMLGWQLPGFDDGAWLNAVELGKPPVGPWHNLVRRPIPLWKDFGLQDYVNHADIPKISDGKTLKMQLPYNAQVTPYLKIAGPAGKKIDLRMDNYGGGKQYNVRAEYITREGTQEYENLGWLNGHEMHYTIPAGFEILALKYRETGYDAAFTGTFACDDEFLNRYRQKALRTLYITMRDTYFDCPDRERAQWWGDAVNELGEAFYALEPRSALLAKKGILELMNWQRADGVIYSPIPGTFRNELPMQMLNSVGYYGFWTYYLHSGDLETMRTVYPRVKKYLAVWKIGDDGLVIPRKGGWTWGDWGSNKDMPILYNGWYYLALKGQLNLAKALGEDADVPAIKAKMASIEENFNKTFWRGQEYRSPDYKGQTDDRAHALAVLTGLAEPEKYPAIRQVFKTAYHSSPYMEKYVGEALYQMRLADDAIARTKKRFKAMTEHHYTTLWEDWEIGGHGGGTINHAWSGGALTLLSQYGAGVAPTAPGYAAYQIMPQMGPLKWLKTIVPSVRGQIKIALQNQPESFTLELESPPATTATVGIPTADKIASVKVNGKEVWRNGKAAATVKGIEFLAATEHYLQFSATPGKWLFEAAKTR